MLPTITRSPDGAIERSGKFINARSAPYGAMGNDSSDDTTALLNASTDARNSGKRLWVPPGSYRVSASIVQAGNPNRLVIEGDGDNTEFVQAAGMPAAVFQATGSLATAVAVAEATAPGAYRLKFDTTGVSPGDYLLVLDSTQPIYGNSAGAGTRGAVTCAAEWVRVKAVDSSTQVTLHQMMEFGYTTSATVRRLTESAMSARRFAIRNSAPGTQSGVARGFALTYWADSTIEDVGFYGLDGHAISIIRGVNGHIINPHFQDMHDLETTNAPYGVSASSSQDLVIDSPRCRYGRHLFTAGGDTTYGPAQHITVNDGWCVEMAATAYDTHPGARKVRFVDCAAHGFFDSAAYTGGAYGVYGFQLRGPDSEIVNGHVSGCPGAAVHLIYGADRCHVMGGRFTHCPIGVDVHSSDDCLIGGGLVIENPTTEAILTGVDTAYVPYMSQVTIGDVIVRGDPTNGPINNAAGITVNYS